MVVRAMRRFVDGGGGLNGTVRGVKGVVQRLRGGGVRA